MGNSEVGHLNLGAGAIVPQDLLRIDKAVEDGSLAENEVILEALRDAPRVHLIGLVSDGGVHSSDRHLKALIELAAKEGVEDLVIHAFTDGRDTSPKGGAKMLATVQGWSTRPAWAGSARSSAATSRWTATRAGTAPRRPSSCCWQGEAEHEAAIRRGGRARRPTSATRPTSSSPPTKVGDEDATIRDGDSVLRVQLPPRPHAPDHGEARRGRRRALRLT